MKALPRITDLNQGPRAVSLATMRMLSVVSVLMASSRPGVAQQFVCHPIRPGETAARLAQRLTGDARNQHNALFRILDPTTSRVISKAEYKFIRPGWLACIATRSTAQSSPRLNGEGAAVAPSPRAASADVARPPGTIDFGFVGWWSAVCLIVALLVWSAIESHLQRALTTLDRMKRFGARFISEFERPLVRDSFPRPAIKSRLRCMPYRQRLDILLAPEAGRRYPNLSDHRRNVEYDVERVARSLRDEPFMRGPLYTQGPWVVIPFQLKTETNTEGAL